MNNLYSIIIRKGTTVLCVNNKQPIELVCDVFVQASRHEDGGYGYTVGRKSYFASAGTVELA